MTRRSTGNEIIMTNLKLTVVALDLLGGGRVADLAILRVSGRVVSVFPSVLAKRDGGL